MSQLRLFLFGPPRLEENGEPLKIVRRKSVALLVYLALMEQPQSRDSVAALLWPDNDQKTASGYLRRIVYALNHLASVPLIVSDRKTVSAVPMAVDAHNMAALLLGVQQHAANHSQPCVACTTKLEAAIALHSNLFLAGFTLDDCPAFEQWQLAQAETWRQQFIDAKMLVSQQLRLAGQAQRAIQHLRDWVAIDPLEERAQWALIASYLDQGQQQQAIEQYERCRALFSAELGIDPSQEIEALFDRYVPPSSRKRRLPRPTTQMIGRDAEFEQLASHFTRPERRLVTLRGVGGVGKTTLALALADRLQNKFADGAVFVDLTSCAPGQAIVGALLDALDLQLFGPASVWDQILTYLYDKALLIVLDNFEHVRNDAARLTELLQMTNHVKLLVTSRERLRLQAEWVVELQGLPHPAPQSASQQAYDAVRLFIDRARHANHRFFASPEELLVIGRITALVNGLPLAIELAAAWVATLSVTEILAELNQGLDFLTQPYHNMPTRHQSLRSVFDYSWQLLQAHEQLIFCQLAVFSGRFDRKALRQITGASMSVLSSLIDKSLLQHTGDGQYMMGEMVRQYAQGQLDYFSAERHAVEARHAAYYLDILRNQEPVLQGDNPQKAMQTIDNNITNIRKAWGWAVAQRDIEQLADGLVTFSEYHELRGRFADAVRIFGEASDVLRQHMAGALLIGRLHIYEAYHHIRLGNYDRAVDLLHDATELVAEDDRSRTVALWQLGYVFFLQGQFERSLKTLTQAKTAAVKTGNGIDLARVHNSLALTHISLGNFAQGQQLLEASIQYSRRARYVRYRAVSTLNLGNLSCIQGDYQAGEQFFQRALMLSLSIDDLYGRGLAQLGRAELALVRGEAHDARRRYEDCLHLQRELGHSYGMVCALLGIGRAYRLLNQQTKAVGYLAEALQLTERIQAWPMMMECLVSLAECAVQAADWPQAVRFAAHAIAHPSCERTTAERAEAVLAQGRAILNSAEFAGYQANGVDTHFDLLTLNLL